MRRDMLISQRWAGLLCGCSVLRNQILNSVGTEPATAHTGKQDAGVILTLPPDPRRQHDHGGFRQRSTSFFAPLSFAANMRSRAEAAILLSNRSDLGEPQTGLKDRQQERMIAAAQPNISVGSRQQRIDLRPSEEAHEWTSLAFVGNSQHALNQSRVLRRF